MDHGPAADTKKECEPESLRATRYGHILFVLYLILYGGFVLISAFAPALMAKTPWRGINLAVLSGLGLIATAFAFALLYDWLCRFLGKTPASASLPKGVEG